MINELIKNLKTHANLLNSPEGFAELVSLITAIKHHFDKEVTYYDPTTQIHYKFGDFMLEFGYDRSQQSRILACHDKYFQVGQITPIYQGFSKSQLIELLVVPSSVLVVDLQAQRITPTMTIKALRKYANRHKKRNKIELDFGDDNPEADNENLIPYNPKTYYDFTYFESKSKQQLLNMIWQLQKQAHKNE